MEGHEAGSLGDKGVGGVRVFKNSKMVGSWRNRVKSCINA